MAGGSSKTASATKDVTGTTCTICGAEADLKCPCETTRYCSKKCQAVDWKDRGHKAVCKKIRAERAAAARGEAAAPEAAPEAGGLVFYGPAERSRADEERSRIRAEHEAARARREAEAAAGTRSRVHVECEEMGETCPVCLDDFDINELKLTRPCCLRNICLSCARTSGESPCPLCRAPWPRNGKEEQALLSKWADADHPQAFFVLGEQYLTGCLRDVKPDLPKATRLLERAADLGHTGAMARLGLCYVEGKGVDRDPARAAALFAAAADRGHYRGQLCLGQMAKERGDDAEAARWFRLSADQGYTNAEYELGRCYEKGAGVPKDIVEARVWYVEAATKGMTKAQSALMRLSRIQVLGDDDTLLHEAEARLSVTRQAQRAKGEKQDDSHIASLGAAIRAVSWADRELTKQPA